MAAVYKIKNVSGSDGTWAGQEIANGDSYTIELTELDVFKTATDLFTAVANGDVQVEDTDKVYTDPVEGWNYLTGDYLPKSDLDDKKLAVHVSYKPNIPGKTTYAAWVGSGDDVSTSPSGLGDGELLSFKNVPGTPTVTKKFEFDPTFGRVWVHEGYLKFNDGGHEDYITSDVVAKATPVQPFANKILHIDENGWITYATGSPEGTHGWGGTPVLIPRTFSKDGDWDYDGTNLTPNFSKAGGYKISTIEQTVHRYFNKIPCCGSSPYFSMTSDETTELPQGYYISITSHNISDTTWHASVIIEIYRERTYLP